MNRKTIVTAVAMLACGAALAAVETTNTLCRIKIASSSKETILSIPLITVGTDGSASPTIDVTKYVLTDGLQNGDKLLLKHDGVWETWKFDGTAWSGGKTVSGDTVTTSSSTLPLGDCICLIRSNPSSTIYLYGELPTNSAKVQTASKGVWTMLGNVKPVSVELSGFTEKCTVKPAAGDIIYLANSGATKQYTYKDSKWQYQDWSNPQETTVVILGTPHTVKTASWVDGSTDKIPAGAGFWYVRSADSALSVNWN
ncbi:MAG: hypothetical protein IIT98_02900 [Kiritimatiellae bacterium]|nr:hypothetical protein [Kiritimatiellia bacterium]